MRATAMISDRTEARCLDMWLAAHRNGDTVALCNRRPQAALWFLRQYAQPMLWEVDTNDPTSVRDAIAAWIGWGLAQIRPDNAAFEVAIERRAWFGSVGWRTYVALVAHFGYVSVPDFPERYRARKDEPAFERLCGLWNTAPSSFYRYVDRGRRALLKALCAPSSRLRASSQCDFTAKREARTTNNMGMDDSGHRLTRDTAAVVGPRFALHLSLLAPLWTAIRARKGELVVALLSTGYSRLAAYEHIDVLLDRMPTTAFQGIGQVDFLLTRALVCHVQSRVDTEQAHLAHALREASAANDDLALARVYAAQAKAIETRDVDRATVDFRASLERYDRLCEDPVRATRGQQAERINVMIRLAWIYIKRNDPRAQIIVEQCEGYADVVASELETLASLAQARAELSRRSGNIQDAVESNLKALQYFERTSNDSQILKVTGTVVLLYGELRNLELAIVYANKIFSDASTRYVEPYTVAATHLNLGIAYFWSERLHDAILSYEHALRIATDANLRPLMARAHYNLAEAFYRRFQQTKDDSDERFGDSHAGLSQAFWEQSNDRVAAEATRNLKRAALGEQAHLIYDRMLPEELAIHFDEMHRIQSQRLVYERAKGAEDKALAQLKIARQYVDIAVKERERALTLVARIPANPAITAQLKGINTAFHRSLSREESLSEHWRQTSADIIASDKLPAVISHIADFGQIKKAQYAALASVSPATASKHLALLAKRGLLVRTNRGRSTAFSAAEPVGR